MAHLCKLCGHPVILVPSAEERSQKYGGTPDFYRSLFRVHNKCQIDANKASQLELIRKLNNDNKHNV